MVTDIDHRITTVGDRVRFDSSAAKHFFMCNPDINGDVKDELSVLMTRFTTNFKEDVTQMLQTKPLINWFELVKVADPKRYPTMLRSHIIATYSLTYQAHFFVKIIC